MARPRPQHREEACFFLLRISFLLLITKFMHFIIRVQQQHPTWGRRAVGPWRRAQARCGLSPWSSGFAHGK